MYYNLAIVKWSALHAWNIHARRVLNSYLFYTELLYYKTFSSYICICACVFEVNSVDFFLNLKDCKI